jgi:hypothetical protein
MAASWQVNRCALAPLLAGQRPSPGIGSPMRTLDPKQLATTVGFAALGPSIDLTDSQIVELGRVPVNLDQHMPFI